MKKQSLIMLVMVVLTIGMVSAFTETDIQFYQADGSATVTTFAEVQGNFWAWPSDPVPETSTGNVETTFSNVGSIDFKQKVIQYGNGQQWPNGAVNEWSMQEYQTLEGFGNTEYNKQFTVWTNHNGWNTDYSGFGTWNMPEGFEGYNFAGSTFSTTPTNFMHNVVTDSSFSAYSRTWVNPFAE